MRPSPRRFVLARAEDEPCELLEWDTEFWGKRIARATAARPTTRDLDAIDAWAATHAIECMYLLADPDDSAAVHAAETAGFRLMDVRVELAAATGVGDADAGGAREAVADDRLSLERIASASHGATRFYADPGFPDARCDELYATWIRRSLDGWADGVLVSADSGAPGGYVTCHLDGDRGSIGLIAVAETARGRGVGTDLARAAVSWCGARGAGEVTVVTQGRNVAALRTFGRAGFLVSSVLLWFHKWYAR